MKQIVRRVESLCLMSALVVLGASFTAEIGDGMFAITNGTPDATHTGAGAAVFERGDAWFYTCSGALISPTVFLSAGHCINALNNSGYPIGVTFEEFVSEPLSPQVVATIVRGTGYLDPAYSPDDPNDPHDLGVIVLETPVTDRPVSVLPSAALLDQLDAMHLLGSRTVFTFVGYGFSGASIPIQGDQSLFLNDQRMSGIEDFNSLQKAFIHAHVNQNQDTNAVCPGDSGGPHYLEVGGQEIEVAISDIAGSNCRNGGDIYNYRLDIPGARAFLGQFVTLP